MQRSLVQLEYRHNLFLLARLSPKDALRREHAVEAAQALLEICLSLWSKRDILSGFQWQFDAIVSAESFIERGDPTDLFVQDC